MKPIFNFSKWTCLFIKDCGNHKWYSCLSGINLTLVKQLSLSNVPVSKLTYITMSNNHRSLQGKIYRFEEMNKIQFKNNIGNRKNYLSSYLFGKNSMSYQTLKNFNLQKYFSGKKEESDIYNKSNKVINQNVPLTGKQKLKVAIKDYGTVIIVFHIGLSLLSLGCCYAIVASGVDLTSIVNYWGINEGAATAGIAANFVIAYAIHKSMAPGRIAITLTAVPFVVKKLRHSGYLRTTKPSSKI